MNAIYPRSPFQAAAQLLYSDAGLTVVRVGDNEGFEATCAISHGNTSDIDVDSLHTDASLAVVVQNDTSGAIRMGAVRAGSFLDWGTPTLRLFESPDSVDVEWTIHDDTLSIDGTLSDWAVIHAPGTIFVWLNGQAEAFSPERVLCRDWRSGKRPAGFGHWT